MKKLVSIVLMGIFSIVFFSFQGCEKKQEDVIKIGAVLPLTGNLAFLGVPEKNALGLAVQEINKSGGVNGNKIRIIYEDSKGEPKQGITSVNKLLHVDKIKIIFTTATVICIPSQKLIEEANAIQMAISMFPKLAEMSGATFRIFPTGWQEAERLIDLHSILGSENVAIFYASVPEMESEVNDYLIPGLKETGVNISLVEQYSLGEKDFKPIIGKIDRSVVDAVILIGFGFNMPSILKEILQTNLDVQITGGIGLMEFPGEKYSNLVEGVKFIAPELILSESKSASSFRSRYIDAYGIEPTYDAYFIYDQFQLVIQALKKSDSNDVDQIKSNMLEAPSYEGVTGQINLLDNGDATVKLIIAQYKNGEIVKY